MNSKILQPGYTISVALYLNGKNLNPNLVTRALGVTPSRSFRRGEKFVGSSTRRSYTRKQGVWVIESTTNSADIADHFSELMSKIQGNVTMLVGTAGITDAYVDVFVATIADSDGGGTCSFVLSHDHLSFLETLGIPVNVTIAVVTP